MIGRLQDKDIAELSWDRNKLVFEETGLRSNIYIGKSGKFSRLLVMWD